MGREVADRGAGENAESMWSSCLCAMDRGPYLKNGGGGALGGIKYIHSYFVKLK